MEKAIKQIATIKFFTYIFIFSIVIFIGHTIFTKNAVFGDGKFYYAYVRSWVFDRDINLVNDFELLGIKPSVNSRGLAINTFAPGSAILWYFPYLLTDNLVRLITLQRTGLELTYQFAVGLINIILGVLGLFFVYHTLKKYFKNQSSLFAAFILFATTNLLFYIAVEPINSHAVSFFISSLVVYYLSTKLENLTLGDVFILGILSGLAGTIRTQDIIIFTIPAIAIFFKFRKHLKILVTCYLLLVTGILLGFLPQIYLWKIFFDFYFPPYGWGYGFTFLSPHISYVLFNIQNGLFILTPTIALGLFGLFLFWKKQKLISFMGIFYFLIQLYLIASWRDYYQGGSYSIRMLITTYPIITFGLAYFIEKLMKQVNLAFILTSIFFLFMINSFLIIRYLLMC